MSIESTPQNQEAELKSFDFDEAVTVVQGLAHAAKNAGEADSVRFAGQLRVLSDTLWREGAPNFFDNGNVI